MKDILFFARDPGGASSLIDIIRQSQLIYDCDIYAKDFARTIFNNNNIKYKEASNIQGLLSILNNYHLIFTGTSHLEYSEHSIWEKSFELNVECIAYLDHWMGYERFYEVNKKKYIFPKTLIVTDNIAKDKIIDKFSDFHIEIKSLGNTFLQKLHNTKLTNIEIEEAKLDKNLNNYEEIIVYAAEVIKGENLEEKYGFNEYSQFEKLYDYLKNRDKNIKLFFIPHPKHNFKDVEFELDSIIQKDTKMDVEISHKDNIVQLSDKVFGINTSVLVEALIYQIPSCSIQIGIKEKSDFELLNRGVIFNANTDEKLVLFINNTIEPFKYDINSIENSLDDIMNFIELKISNEKI